jgi:hypothetical protein
MGETDPLVPLTRPPHPIGRECRHVSTKGP